MMLINSFRELVVSEARCRDRMAEVQRDRLMLQLRNHSLPFRARTMALLADLLIAAGTWLQRQEGGNPSDALPTLRQGPWETTTQRHS